MLGLDNPLHIAFVLVLLLLVFGAKRLPEMGKSLGAGLRGFKESISGEDAHEHLPAAHAPVRIDEMHETTPAAASPSASAPAAAPVRDEEPLHAVADPATESVAPTPMQPVA